MSAFAQNPKFFAEDMRFGASLWEMYVASFARMYGWMVECSNANFWT